MVSSTGIVELTSRIFSGVWSSGGTIFGDEGGVVSVEVSKLTSGSTDAMGEDGITVPVVDYVGSTTAVVGWAGSTSAIGSASGSGRSTISLMV
ncbi:hypothetical protein ACFXTH_044251 [Malus domestica]